MLSLCCTWLPWRHAIRPSRRRRAAALLQLEPLEDRFAPAGLVPAAAPDSASVPLLPGLHSPTSPSGSAAQSRVHDSPSRSDLLLLSALAIRHAQGQGDLIHHDPDSHPFLSDLASRLLSLSFGAALPSATPNTFTGDLSSLSAPHPNVTTSPMIALANAPNAGGPGSTITSLLVSLPGQTPAGNGLPLTIDPPAFAADKPLVKGPPKADGPMAFELSPLLPFGLDVVPIPVPRGLEEGMADLFGTPAPSPAPRRAGNALGESNADPDAVRAAVLQMLHEHPTLPTVGNLEFLTTRRPVAPSAPAEVSVPPALPDGTIMAGTPLDPICNGDGEESPHSPPAQSVAALLAASAGLVLRHWSIRRKSAVQSSSERASEDGPVSVK